MVRLVDLNELAKKFNEMSEEEIRAVIKGEQTIILKFVEAIPLEWFHKYFDISRPEWDFNKYRVALEIVQDWREENEEMV